MLCSVVTIVALRKYMAKVGVQYSHVWVCGRASDLQVHSHVALLSIVQPVGPQAEVHLWRPFNLKIQSANSHCAGGRRRAVTSAYYTQCC